MTSLNRRSLVRGMGASGLALGLGGKAALAGGGQHHQSHHNILDRCIANCTECYQVCQETLLHCLKLGGEHAAPDHIRLLLDCIEICKTSIDFMINQSPFHKQICAVCADICQKCAESCNRLAGSDELMEKCAATCRRCEDTCRQMAAA